MVHPNHHGQDGSNQQQPNEVSIQIRREIARDERQSLEDEVKRQMHLENQAAKRRSDRDALEKFYEDIIAKKEKEARSLTSKLKSGARERIADEIARLRETQKKTKADHDEDLRALEIEIKDSKAIAREMRTTIANTQKELSQTAKSMRARDLDATKSILTAPAAGLGTLFEGLGSLAKSIGSAVVTVAPGAGMLLEAGACFVTGATEVGCRAAHGGINLIEGTSYAQPPPRRLEGSMGLAIEDAPPTRKRNKLQKAGRGQVQRPYEIEEA